VCNLKEHVGVSGHRRGFKESRQYKMLLSSTVRLCYGGSEKGKCSPNQKDVQLVERKQ